MAQVAWVVLAAYVLLMQVIAVQAVLKQVHVICVEPNCVGAEVTRQQAGLLHDLRLPVEFYGVYVATVLMLFFGVFAVVASILIWRRASDRLAVFTAFTLLLFGGLTITTSQGLSISPWSQYVANNLGLLGSYGMILFFYLFPDGRLILWRPLFFTLPWDVFQAGQYLAPGSAIDINRISPLLSIASWFVALASVLYVQVYRYRRVSSPPQRQQTKWIIYGFTTALSGFFLMVVLSNIRALLASPLFLLIGPIGFFGFLGLIPLSMGFAMLRYRLWDIDVLINRTLVYALLTACLAGFYIAAVVLLQSLFRVLTGQGSGLAVAISTLAIAALFQPLRRGIQSAIDRRFYRRKYDASRTLAAFSSRLRNDVDLDQVTGEIVAVVEETMQPVHVSLWLR